MNFKKQKGVALAVGLVMLLVLTIMGISSMSNTTLQLKIACNSQTHNDAFQASMSCINDSITKVDRAGQWPQLNNCVIANSNTSAAVSTDYLGCQVAIGSSLETAASENVFEVSSQAVATGCGGQA
ncbi:MAG: hypothetical protein KAU21_16810, partial [Gammaproteobacteria bacterium]|nr:hypothetical protein [Gammaproteobacteria bacterium]